MPFVMVHAWYVFVFENVLSYFLFYFDSFTLCAVSILLPVIV